MPATSPPFRADHVGSLLRPQDPIDARHRRELESKDEPKRRCEEASNYVPLDQPASSSQCGFAITLLGNTLTVEDEKAKLQPALETTEETWG
jgi:5-methyltetrahydropteroyltriglutamate--homocysteine methyltransferase